jgi:16S rRNA processing protein RimM
MAPQSDWIKIGQIVASFGLKGQVKVKSLTDFPSRFEKGSRLRLKGEWVEVEACRWQDGRPVLQLSGVRNIDQAQALKWEYLEIPASSLPTLSEEEFMLDDLLGLQVITTEGVVLGQLDSVMNMPAQDVLVVGTIMIPAVKQFVKRIDLESGTIEVALIPGMIES